MCDSDRLVVGALMFAALWFMWSTFWVLCQIADRLGGIELAIKATTASPAADSADPGSSEV